MVDAEILDGEELQVARWRHKQLVALGLDDQTADLLANGSTDWHQLEALLAAGCALDVAVRIVR